MEQLQGYLRSSILNPLRINWTALSILIILASNTVKSNTLIESFPIPRNRSETLQIDRFLLIKHSDSNQVYLESNNAWDKDKWNDWQTRIRSVVEQTEDENQQDLVGSIDREPSIKSTDIISIKPNSPTRLRLELSRTPLPQTFSYVFLMSKDEQLGRTLNGREAKTPEKLFDPFSNSIDHSVNTILRFFGRPAIEHQRFSVRFSWDASDYVDLHLDLENHPPSSLLSDLFTPTFFNLTITPNFDKFHSAQADSFIDLIVMIEPLLLNLLPMFTLLPLFSTCLSILLVIYMANLPAKFENFIKSLSV